MTTARWAVVLAPSIVLFVLFFAFPQVAFLRASLYEYAGPGALGAGPTLANYEAALSDAFIQHAIVETLKVALLVTVAAVLLAYPVAFAIARSGPFVSNSLFVVVVASMFTSAIVRALGWRVLLSDYGTVNSLMIASGLIGSPVPLIGNPIGVVIGLVHVQIPFAVLTLMPACEAVSTPVLYAAYGLGASRWYAFWRIVLPLTISGIGGAGLLVFALTAGSFTTASLLSGGRVALLSLLIRQQTLQVFDYPAGATIAVILVVILVPVLLVGSALGSRSLHGGSVGGG